MFVSKFLNVSEAVPCPPFLHTSESGHRTIETDNSSVSAPESPTKSWDTALTGPGPGHGGAGVMGLRWWDDGVMCVCVCGATTDKAQTQRDVKSDKAQIVCTVVTLRKRPEDRGDFLCFLFAFHGIK